MARTTMFLSLLAPSAAQLFCPTGYGLFHTTNLVRQSQDDVEEFQAGDNCNEGFLYQGSSDLEIGNDVDQGRCGQYVGVRFQELNVPQGAQIMQASMKFTVDESTNPIMNATTGQPIDGSSYWGNWTAPLGATIRARKTPNAGPWLDPASTDPAVVANRDCTLQSGCMNNYDCHALSGFGFVPADITCDYFEGGTFAATMNQVGYGAYLGRDANGNQITQCDCSGCLCGTANMPRPRILQTIWNNESTTAEAIWTPGGEHLPECEGSCPSGGARRVQFTSEFRDVMNEVISLPGWQAGNAIALIIDGHAEHDNTPTLRSYESWNGVNTAEHSWTSTDPIFAPTLWVSYCTPPPADAGGAAPSTSSAQSSGSSDDDEGTVIIVAVVAAVLVALLLGTIGCFIMREKAGKPIFTQLTPDAPKAVASTSTASASIESKA